MGTTPFSHPIRVRWGEVDAQGVVFNPNYFVYVDVASTEFFRAAGMVSDGIPDLVESYVVDARASFRASARFDEVLDVRVWVGRIGRSSYDLRIDITREGETLVEAHMTYVRARGGRSEPLSDAFRAGIEAFNVPPSA